MAVVYVGINKQNGMLYVGKHEHGTIGQSTHKARWMVHGQPSVSNRKSMSYIGNAIRKYGRSSFSWFILEHVSDDLVSEREAFWISHDGLDTLAPNGYNLAKSDKRGKVSAETRQRMSDAAKEVAQRPGRVEMLRARGKRQFETQEARDEASERLKTLFANRTEEEKEENKKRQKIALSGEETRTRMRKSAVARAESEPRGARSAWATEIQNRPEQREKLRQAKLKKRVEELANCNTEEERDALLVLFEKRDEFNARVNERKKSGEVRVKRGTPEHSAKMRANRTKAGDR